MPDVINKEVAACARFQLISPRKIRFVMDLIRGKRVVDAESTLTFLPHRAARLLKKVLRSATANAEHNFHFKKDRLRIAKGVVDEGPILRRFQPRARGRAFPIKKKMSHVTLVLKAGA